MGEFKTNIEAGSGPYKDWLTVQRVDEIRKERGEELEKIASEKSPDLLLFSGLLLHARKIFNLLSSATQFGHAAIIESPTGLIPYLANLKKILHELSKSDQSQNVEFVQKFSDSWNELIQAFSTIQWAQRKDLVVITAISALFAGIGSYPLGQEHSLGFYLSRFAGEKWLPFPFIELLSSLHTNKKLLHEWIRMADAIISHLSS